MLSPNGRHYSNRIFPTKNVAWFIIAHSAILCVASTPEHQFLLKNEALDIGLPVLGWQRSSLEPLPPALGP